MNRRSRERRPSLTKVDCGKILRQKKIANSQIVRKRSCEAGTDQTIELLACQKFSNALAADFFSDAGMKDFNHPIIDPAANYLDAVAISPGFIA
jgi:hypothetical protein